MRSTLLYLSILLLVMGGCKKYDLDIDALNDNPFDPDGSGPALFTLDSIRTVAIVTGALHQQRIYLTLSPELLEQNDWRFQYLESTIPDTLFVGPSAVQQGRLTVLNNQVQLGTTYCFKLDLIIGIPLDNRQVDTCVVAQL